MRSRFSAPKSSKTEVFFTDEKPLEALAQANQDLLDDEASGVERLASTIGVADYLLGVIREENEKAEDPSYQRPKILHLELGEEHQEVLRIARRRFSESTTESGLGSVALGV